MTARESLSPDQRSLRARIASHSSWAATEDVDARTRPGRDAAFRKFEDQVDPDRVLSEEERFRRAKSAQRARMTQLAFRRERARKSK